MFRWMFAVLGLLILSGGSVKAQTAEEQKATQTKVIILLGPPGSGKGTQAVRLSKELGIPHISTGDLFRDHLSRNTDLGKKVKSYMDSGNLVPDALVLDMLFARISQPDSAKGYLLDGFPRTIPQAEALDVRLKNDIKKVVINLEVADDVIINRMAGRLTCRACGAIFNKNLSPPKTEGRCDKCGGELYQRPDDAVAIVEGRLRVYHEQTKPLIAYYKKQGILFDVNGEQSPDEVFANMMQILSGRR